MKCTICGHEMKHDKFINYMGNNPYPVRTDENARCCDDCNTFFVIPARLSLLKSSREEYEATASMLNRTKYQELKEMFSTCW